MSVSRFGAVGTAINMALRQIAAGRPEAATETLQLALEWIGIPQSELDAAVDRIEAAPDLITLEAEAANESNCGGFQA